MDKLENFIAHAAHQIAKLRKQRDLHKGEIARLELLEEQNTWSYKLEKRKLKELEPTLIQLVMDYTFAKDLKEAEM